MSLEAESSSSIADDFGERCRHCLKGREDSTKESFLHLVTGNPHRNTRVNSPGRFSRGLHTWDEEERFVYCRIGIYSASEILRKADFSVFRVYFISRASKFYSAIC